jgi:hypothetical protein
VSLARSPSVVTTKFTGQKGEVFPDYAMESYRGSRGIAPPIVNPGTGKETWYPLKGRLCGSESRAGLLGVK